MDTVFPRPLCQDNSQRGSGGDPGARLRRSTTALASLREGSAHPEERLLAVFDSLTQGQRRHLAMTRLWVASPAPFSSSRPSRPFFFFLVALVLSCGRRAP